MNKKWNTTCIQANDGTGDLIIELPADLLEEMSWRAGDTLNFEILVDRTIQLSKLQWTGAERDQSRADQDRESFD